MKYRIKIVKRRNLKLKYYPQYKKYINDYLYKNMLFDYINYTISYVYDKQTALNNIEEFKKLIKSQKEYTKIIKVS